MKAAAWHAGPGLPFLSPHSGTRRGGCHHAPSSQASCRTARTSSCRVAANQTVNAMLTSLDWAGLCPCYHYNGALCLSPGSLTKCSKTFSTRMIEGQPITLKPQYITTRRTQDNWATPDIQFCHVKHKGHVTQRTGCLPSPAIHGASNHTDPGGATGNDLCLELQGFKDITHEGLYRRPLPHHTKSHHSK